MNNQNFPQQPGFQPQQAYPAPPPVPAPPKKRRTWLWIVGAVVAVVVIAGVANQGKGGDTPADQPTGVAAGNEATNPAKAEEPAKSEEPATPAQRVVVYRVDGTGTASVTYTTDGMTTMNQESGVQLPWEKTINLPAGEALQMVSIVAQGDGTGKIDVTITVDGKPFKEAHADGYGVATANGNIGTLG